MLKPNPAQDAVLNAQGNILVSASAGTGKTTAMVGKILNFLVQGGRIDRLLVMTFTKAAAAEMKERLAIRLYEEVRRGGATHGHLVQQLHLLPSAKICTFDSFCMDLFKKHFTLVGRDPACTLLLPEDAEVLLADAVDTVCREYLEVEDKAFLSLACHFSQARKLDRLKDAVKGIRHFLNVQPNPMRFLQDSGEALLLEEHSPYVLYIKDCARKGLRRLIQDGRQVTNILHSEDIAEAGTFLAAVSVLQQAAESDTLQDIIHTLSFLLIPEKIRQRKDRPITETGKELSSRFIDDLREWVKEFSPLFESFSDKYSTRLCYEESKKLLEVAWRAEALISVAKKSRNEVEYADCARYALTVLRNDDACKEVRDSFDYLFIDEYQDTNYLQEEILNRVWNGDNIFVVGDMKQSIYRFRFAEPAIFAARMAEYDNERIAGKNIFLNENYRSSPEVIDFINEVFDANMTEEFGGTDYRQGDARLKAGEKAFEKVSGFPAVQIVAYREEVSAFLADGVYSVERARERTDNPELCEIYRILLEMVGKERLYFPKTTSARFARFGDFAVLVRSNKQAEVVRKYLEGRGVPCTAGDRTLPATREIKALADFLRILHHPDDDIALGNVLCAGIFPITSLDLLKIKKEHPEASLWGALNQYNEEDAIRKKIDGIRCFLSEFRFLSSYLRASELLKRLLREGYDARLLRKGADCISAVNGFIAEMEKKEADKSTESFLRYYDTVFSGVKPPVAEDAVTVSTIHKSKGLEYPVVILPYLGDIGGGNRTEVFFQDREFGIAMKNFYDESTAVRDNFATLTHKMKSKQLEREEGLRLFYVALTRAKNHLILIGKVPKDERGKRWSDRANCFMDWLLITRQQNPDFHRHFRPLAQNIPEMQTAADTVIPEGKPLDLSRLHWRYPHEKATVCPQKFTVSGILAREHGEEDFSKPLFSVKKEVGVLYHAVMQYIDYGLNTVAEVSDAIKALATAGRIDAEAVKLVDAEVIFKALQSDLISYARKNTAYRELPFMLYAPANDIISDGGGVEDKILVQGIIDLLILGENVVLVDFKATFRNPNELVAAYTRQIEIYKQAAERMFGRKVSQAFIYNIFQNTQIPI